MQKLSLISSAGPIGTLAVTTNANVVDVDWRVDDNGRGPKIKKHIELGKDRLPAKWELEGKGWVGAPVKESFWLEGGKAKWKSLDDESEGAVVLLADQPGVTTDVVRALIDRFRTTRMQIVRAAYRDGPGPSLLSREIYGEAGHLHGDVGARVLAASHPDWVEEVPVDADVPEDVDLPEDLA